MTTPYTLPLDDPSATLKTVGGKGASLARLARAGLPVPDGFYLTTAAYDQFIADNSLQPLMQEVLAEVDPAHPASLERAAQRIHQAFNACPVPQGVCDALKKAYLELSASLPAVAVRSSATAEDLPELSFAGQQETFLNVSGVSAVQEKVRQCWASLWTVRAIAYRLQHQIAQSGVSLAVVVQVLIEAESAGILFTANPLSGSRDEMLINAAWGLGEAIVGGRVTPDTLVTEKQTGKLKQLQIADKMLMTVRTEEGTTEQPVPDELRNRAVLAEDQLAELVGLAKQIEVLFGSPQDIEWCQQGGKIHILQSRPITNLPAESLPPASIQWQGPNPKGLYMRGSLVDLLPDPLSPLFESLAIPAVVQGAYRIAGILTRSEPSLPDDYVTSINHYAYMSASFTRRSWFWVLFRLLPAFPRLLRMVLPFWRDEIRPNYRQQVEDISQIPTAQLANGQLWRDAQQLTEAAMYYMASLLFATMGASAGAEALLTRVYQKLVQKPGDPPAASLLMGYDSLPIQAEKSLFDLARSCHQSPTLVDFLLASPARQISQYLYTGTRPTQVSREGWDSFAEQFELHLSRFGHMIYQLDFVYPLPVNEPAPLFETLKMYLRGSGTNPHQRQKLSADKREQTAQAALARSKGFKRWAFKHALRIGQSMSQVREDALADIGLGYPRLRQLLEELGRRLVEAGVLAEAQDIYWLEKSEIEMLVNPLEGQQPTQDYLERIAQRKKEHQALKRLTPPPTIPLRKKYMGISLDDYTAASETEQTTSTLKGVPTSRGKVTAAARVLRGPHDFDQMQPGEVLVAGATTPAWTPLFAMASAVVTDIGGPLTHGSIVAREYGIPAVMGTGVATRRIRNGQLITVDGDLGTVILRGE